MWLVSSPLIGWGNSLVFCVESDRQVSVETIFGGSCTFGYEVSRRAIPSAPNELSTAAPCASCTDIPIVTLSESSTSRKLDQTITTVFDLPFVVSPHGFAELLSGGFAVSSPPSLTGALATVSMSTVRRC